jgi:heptosyltransferase-2
VQLIKVADSYHLWSQTYDRTLEDIFAVQDDIAQSVVKELRTTLLGETADAKASGAAKAEVAMAVRGRSTDPEAHRLYLQARPLLDRRTREDTAKGIGYLKDALALDAGYALAWAELCRAYAGEADRGYVPVAEGYGRALIMPRTWKSALAPALAGVPERIGFMGEARFGLVNDIRFGERRLARMVDRCVALALPRDADAPARLPLPELKVPGRELAAWRERLGLASDGRRPVVALAPGAVGPSKRWPTPYYADLAQRLAADGAWVWIIGGPGEKEIAAQIVRTQQGGIRDLTGPDLRNAILALAAAKAAVSNDSGLLHVAAALGTPAVGIFGPTSPWHWAPLNPIAAVIETTSELPCRPCHKPVCRLGHHLCMRDISVDQVSAAIRQATLALPAAP